MIAVGVPHTAEPLLLVGGLLVALAVVATRVSVRLGVPALILFLLTGMLAGSDGPGGIWFDDPGLTWSIGVVTLAVQLLAGGLETELAATRAVLAPGLALATVGVLLSTGATAGFYAWAFDRPLLEGVLLGAIVSSTDAAAVFGVLRGAGLRLQGRIQPLLEMESGSNDPMAIWLTLAISALLAGGEASFGAALGQLVTEMAVGLGAGVLGGRLIAAAVARLQAPQEGLYAVFVLASGLALFGLTTLLHGSGFLAIYVAGVVIGSRPVPHRRTILRFHDALAWLAQITMFLLLGLLVFPSRLPGVAAEGVLLAAFLLLIARPLAVAVSLTPFGFPWRHQVMVSWVGLRGAVPIVLATAPRVLGVEGAERVFDTVFFVVLLSVLVQGMSLPRMARALGVIDAPTSPLHLPDEVHGASVLVAEVAPHLHDRPLVDLRFPPGARIALVERGGEVVVPEGSTRLQAGDRTHVVVREDQEEAVRKLLCEAPG